ncbi:hypothetical protein L1887_38326 [Cichorium endivia]|nr:hypothetical protein L1887_38326 [Cichorium endivia]
MDRIIESRPEAHPPDIAFFHILPRLPKKSVRRFTRVSKQWHSFLTTSVFAKMQNTHHLLTNKLGVLSATRPYMFCTIDRERPEHGFTASRPLPFKVGPCESIRILTSVNGLLCVGITKTDPDNLQTMPINYSDLILWNPATGDHKTLSKPLSCYKDCYETYESTLFGLYHRSCDDDLKLLRITVLRNVYIYSLKSDSWRKEVGSGFQCTRVDYWVTYFWEPNVSLNENIYFLEYAVGNTYSIVKFNTKTETLEVIATPPFGNPRTSCWNFVFLKDGCIHLWVNIEKNDNELWRMDGDGDWTKIANSGNILCRPRRCHRPIHLMRNGNFLMYNGGGRCVYQLDMMEMRTQDLYSYTTKTLHVWPAWKYIETMVSPNQYMK